MISLPLAKLSTAQDDSADAKQLSWKHDSRDLSIVLDTFGARDTPSQLLKVIQGLQVLHLIEVERLVNDGKDLIRTMQERGIELKSEQLPISALVRCPLLAIRWQLPNQKVRRIQLRFKNSQDFDTMFNQLNQLGLRLSPANESGSRSSEPNSTRTAPLPASSPPGPPGSATSSRAAGRSSRPYSALAAPTALEAKLQEAAHLGPVSASPWQHGNSETISTTLPGPLKPPEYFVRPDSANSASLGSFDEAFSSVPSAPLMRSPEIAPQFAYQRPDTALLYDRQGTNEALLPPRRELPFARTSLALSSGSDRPSSRPSTALMGPPPLPARVSSLRPHSSRVHDQLNELPELPKPTVLDSPMQQPSWMQQAATHSSHDKPSSHHGQGEVQRVIENVPTSGTNLASSPLPGKRVSPFTNTLSRPLSSLNDATKNTRRPGSRSSLSTPPTSNIHQYRTAPENSPTTSSSNHSSDDLAKYLMQSAEGRRAALNEFIFQCLEDENFITLVEDMETCYARIGVNMK